MARKKRRTRRSFVLISLVVLMVGYGYISFQRPLPIASPVYATLPKSSSQKVSLAWPAWGQAAVGQASYGVLESHGQQVARPTASVAKIMTALAVLKQKPLKLGEQGPLLTINETDVSYYSFYSSNDGSHVPVVLGQQLSEYQALQALLLPSANNIADSLVNWVFGSEAAYSKYANELAASLGMKDSRFTGASGFSADTVSTAQDLVLLGIAALGEPVIAEIARQTEAVLPVVGLIRNTNWLIGSNEVTGLKTGHTDEAGGCYLFATEHTYRTGQKITIVGAIMSAPTLREAMEATPALISSLHSGFATTTIAVKGQKIASYRFPWGAVTEGVLEEDVAIFGWQGTAQTPNIGTEPLEATGTKSQVVGALQASTKLDQKRSAIRLNETVEQPSLWWRLTRH